MNLKKLENRRNFVLIGLSILIFSTLFFPLYAGRVIDLSGSRWEEVYTYTDEEFKYYAIAFYVLFLGSRIIKQHVIRLTMTILCCFYAGFVFLIGALSIVFIAQDYVPLYGSFISMSFLPGLIILAVLDYQVHSKNKSATLSVKNK